MARRYLYLSFCLAGALLIWLGIYLYNYLPSFDSALLKCICSPRSNFLSTLSFTCSFVGNYFVAPLTIIAATMLSLKKQWHYFTQIVATVILASLSCTLLKAFIMRPRPMCLGFKALVDEPYFSFPSGHTTGSSALILAFLTVLWQTSMKRTYKITCTILGIILAVSVAWSRLYNAVHFPSDIIGSLGLVVFFNFATLYIIENSQK